MDRWNNSSQASAAACPNCRTELIAFFINETDNATIIEANTFIPNGSQIQCELVNKACQELWSYEEIFELTKNLSP